MRWVEAVDRIQRPDITNRDAAGLLIFVRKVHAQYASRYALPPFDWIAFALPAFGWRERGDRLVVSRRQQEAPYAASEELWQAIEELASDLDEQGQGFSLLSDPRGTDDKFRRLADDTQRAIAGAGGRMGAITSKDARALVDRSKDLAITNAKRNGKTFVYVQASADGSVFTDEFETLADASAALEKANDDDQILAAGIWNTGNRKLVTQKAGALEVRADKPATPVATPAEPAPVTAPAAPQTEPDITVTVPEEKSSSGWLILLVLVALSSKKGRW